jgi:hypothetical protein
LINVNKYATHGCPQLIHATELLLGKVLCEEKVKICDYKLNITDIFSIKQQLLTVAADPKYASPLPSLSLR